MHSFTARLIASPEESAGGTADARPVRITIRNGHIAAVMPIDVSDSELAMLPFVAPGLFDLQMNGYRGIWFSSDELTVDQVEQVIHDYAAHGVTRCLPTLITNSIEAIEHGLRTIRQAVQKSAFVRDVIVGCHVEGPFISPLDGPRGAHPAEHVRPATIAEVQRWQAASGGLVRLITLAPEVTGTSELIPFCMASGIRIAIGHTSSGATLIRQAIDLGATLGTHLGNGCSAMVPRHDNPFWAQLADDRLTCSLIADSWHVPPELLAVAVRCKSPERIVLTSDVSGFGGCPVGRYSTAALSVDVLDDGRIVVAGQTQFLAGSGVLTGDCVAEFLSQGLLDLPQAWASASTVPAKLLGFPDRQVREGSAASLTVFRLIERSGPTSERLRFVPVETYISGSQFRATR